MYKPNLVLLVDFGKYCKGRKKPLSVDQIPLAHFKGLSYLGFLQGINISKFHREQIGNVIQAYEDFPVKIKCTGKGGSCSKTAKKIVLPWEYISKHEKQRGPEWRKQFFIPENPFYCPECSEEFTECYKADSLWGKGTMEFPISFRILKWKGEDWNLDRKRLHRELQKVAYEILFQGLEIDTSKMKDVKRISFTYEQAKEIVNQLLGAYKQGALFKIDDYEIKKLYVIRRRGQKSQKQMSLNL